MKGLLDLELGYELGGAGKRLFRVEVGDKRAVVIGFEAEVDPGGLRDFRHEAATDVDIAAVLRRAVVLLERGESGEVVNHLRGGQD